MPSNQTYFKFGLSVAQAPTVGCWCNSRYCRLFAVFVILFAMGHLAQLGSAEDVGQWPSCRIIRCPPAAFDISTQIRHILIEKDYKLYIYHSNCQKDRKITRHTSPDDFGLVLRTVFGGCKCETIQLELVEAEAMDAMVRARMTEKFYR
jgi:hypothetical protein